MRISDWSSDVCSSDLEGLRGIYSKSRHGLRNVTTNRLWGSYVKSGTGGSGGGQYTDGILLEDIIVYAHQDPDNYAIQINAFGDNLTIRNVHFSVEPIGQKGLHVKNCNGGTRSEEHTSELQSLMRISY